MRPTSLDLVIFDCDGVLVDSEPIANRVLSERLACARSSDAPARDACSMPRRCSAARSPPSVAYCVASNSSRARMHVALAAAGLLARFAGRMFSAAEVARPKPSPDVFLHAAQCIGVPPGLRAAGASTFADMRLLGGLLV